MLVEDWQITELNFIPIQAAEATYIKTNNYRSARQFEIKKTSLICFSSSESFNGR